jgi:hypothetical protein
MIVASPNELIVASLQPPTPVCLQERPTRPLEPIDDNIANPTSLRQKLANEAKESIAARVERHARESINAVYTLLENGSTEMAYPVLDVETRKLLEYCQLRRDPRFKDIWERSAANDFGMLAQGVGNQVKGTNTIFFIHKNEVPPDRFKTSLT